MKNKTEALQNKEGKQRPEVGRRKKVQQLHGHQLPMSSRRFVGTKAPSTKKLGH